MKRVAVTFLLAWLPACATAPPPTTTRYATVNPPNVGESAASKPIEETSAVDAPAEPFSATWAQAEEFGAEPPGPTNREAWVNADACPDPVTYDNSDAYDSFIVSALGMAGHGQLAAIRISASFRPERALSIERRADGAYLLRSTELSRDVWAWMMTEMRELQGTTITLDDASESEALARVTTSRTVKERGIDATTAWLLVDVWRTVIARAQIVRNVGVMQATADGTAFEIRYGGKAASTHNPASGSVLGEVTTAAEHLARVLDGHSTDELAELDVARDLLRSALARSHQREPCLRRYFLP